MAETGMVTLEELKRENEAEESGELESTAETIEETDEIPEDEAEEIAAEEETDEDEEETGEAEVEPWMQTEEEEQPKFTDSDAAAIRRKYKAREEKIREEAEAERKRLEEELEKARAAQSSQKVSKPDRDSFETDEDYFEALADYRLMVRSAEQSTQQAAEAQRRAKAERDAQIAKEVDAHYLRAHQLAEKSGIKAEAYQSADLRFREAIDSVFPEAGDAVADYLIASMGEGSEKVVYHLGVNQKKRDALIASLRSDPNGMQAATFLGKLSGELSAPAKRQTRAPEPPADIHGDQNNRGPNEGAFKKKYQEAHKSGDGQKAFNIKREAKAKGIDTSGW